MSGKLSRRTWLKSAALGGAFLSFLGNNCKKEENKLLKRTRKDYQKFPELEYDIVVCGGGPGGICAAIAAARLGKRVLLIERYGFLGGTATAGLVTTFCDYAWGQLEINRGIFAEIRQRLIEKDGYKVVILGLPRGIRGIFDPEILKIVEQEICLESGVELLYHAFVREVECDNSGVKTVIIATKGGDITINGKVFIDATGDGDVAYLSGAEYEFGREDGLTQPASLQFKVANVNESGRLHQGVTGGSTGHLVKYDATNPFDLTKLQIEGLKRVDEKFRSLKKDSAKYENAYIQKIATQVGIRETRRIIGDYVLDENDLLSFREFPDKICRGCFFIDIHNPEGEGVHRKFIPEGKSYEIPYRSLLVKGKNNLIMGCRAISATHSAHSAIRIQPIVMSIGQAAGTAAALSVEKGVSLREVPINELQDRLKKDNMLL